MFDFFEKVLGFLETLLGFVSQLALNLSTGIDTIAKMLIFPIELSGFLPSFIGSSMLIVIAFAVLKFILGR